MQLKEGFVLRQVAGETIVLPAGDLNINAMITLNDTGAFLWKLLEQETTPEALTEALLGEYDVDRETAELCVSRFVEKLQSYGFLR